jgi:hypothetical protein
MIYCKTRELIHAALKNITKESNFFSTIAGSRTLAMLTSFEDGRDIVKQIFGMNIYISIFSYPRSINERTKNDQKDYDDDDDCEEMEEYTREITTDSSYSNNSLVQSSSGISSYRSSKRKDVPEYLGNSILENENILTILIENFAYDLYKLVFNRILLDSKELGPGCLSVLSDALIYLQEEGNYGKYIFFRKN